MSKNTKFKNTFLGCDNGVHQIIAESKQVLQDSQTILFHLSCSACHLRIITNAGYIYQHRALCHRATQGNSVTLWEEVSSSPPADRKVAGQWPCSKVAKNLCIFEITGRLWWQHFRRGFHYPTQMHPDEFTERMEGFSTLLPPPTLPSAGTGWHATQACFLLSFLPQLCSQVSAISHLFWASPG